MARRVVIWGAGGHARVVAEIIRLSWALELAGFLDDVNPERQGESFGGATILGGCEQLDTLDPREFSLIFGFGDCEARLRLSKVACAHKFSLMWVNHPRATVAAGVVIGGGTVIMAGAVVQPGTGIGRNVIINTGATVDHDCGLDDGVHIAPGAHLCSHIKVHRGAFVGAGAVVVPGVTIGPGAIIGAGSVVLNDVPHSTVVYGNPARAIRAVREGDFGRLGQ